MPDTIYTVRIAKDDIRQLSTPEIEALDTELIRIKRSNGEIEYATEAMITHLETNRRQRRNQRKLTEMQDGNSAKKPSVIATLFKRLLG